MTKAELRKQAYEFRESLDPFQVEQYSKAIQQTLFAHLWFQNSRNLFIYVSMRNEVQTHKIIDASLHAGKTVCVPRVLQKENMVAVPIKDRIEDLHKGYFQTMEPKPHLKPLPAAEMDLVVVPGLLFSTEGFRIGYGGGYYDRYLETLSPHCKTIGLAYSFQVIPNLCHESHDRKVMLVITELESIGGTPWR